MNEDQAAGGPARWPYHVTLKSWRADGWHGVLYQGQMAVARIVSPPFPQTDTPRRRAFVEAMARSTSAPAPVEAVDLRFDVAAHEAAFLTWLSGVRLPAGVERTPEAVVVYLMAVSGDPAPRPTDSSAAALFELLGGPVDTEGELVSGAPPLPLSEACSHAMRLLGVSEGDVLEMGDSAHDVGHELGGLALLLLSDHEDRFNVDRIEKVRTFAQDAAQMLNLKFTLDDQVQDASFFADLYEVDLAVGVRFSAFGRLALAFTENVRSWTSEGLPVEVVHLLQRHGYDVVQPEDVTDMYDGALKNLRGETTWFGRLFDYL